MHLKKRLLRLKVENVLGKVFVLDIQSKYNTLSKFMAQFIQLTYSLYLITTFKHAGSLVYCPVV